MHQAEHLSLESIRGFLLVASEEIRFESQSRQQRYVCIEQLLVQHEYPTLGKSARGLVRRYIASSRAAELNAFYRDFLNPYLNYHPKFGS